MTKGIVLDVLPKGAPFTLSHEVDSRIRKHGFRAVRGGYLTRPLAFVLTKEKTFLAVAVLKEGTEVSTRDEVDLSNKDEVEAWARINHQDLSSAAKSELEDTIDELIERDEEHFVEFFNKATPITTRMHSLELLPGIGKKHMWGIIKQRRKPFESLDEIKERVPLLPSLEKSIKKRILEELEGDEKYNLFVYKPRR